MDFDYAKIINFFYGRNVDKLNDVLKVVLSDNFTMLDVNMQARAILLIKNNTKYILTKRENRLIIFPDNYRGVCLTEQFGELIEISINDEGNVIVSKIFNSDDPKGVVAMTSTWHYEEKMYIEVVCRVMFVEQEKLDVIENKQSIEMFLSKYYPLRNDVLNDLYWDFNALMKNVFIKPKVFERIMVSDGYTRDKFEEFYKKQTNKALNIVKEKGKISTLDSFLNIYNNE